MHGYFLWSGRHARAWSVFITPLLPHPSFDTSKGLGAGEYQEVGVPSPGLVHMGSTAEAPPAAAATTTESVRRFRAPTSEEPLSASATQEA